MAGPAGCLAPHILPSGDFFPTPKLPQGSVQQVSAVQKCSGLRGGLLRFRLAFTVSLCPPRLSFQWSNQVVREAGGLPEAERTAWGGKSPSRGQTSGGDEDRGTATQEPTRSGVWREEAARGPSPLHRTGHTPWAGRAPFSLALH